MQSHHGHNEALRRQHLVLGEPEHQALQHLVAGCAPSFPQQRPQVVAASLTSVSAVEFVECDLQKKRETFLNGTHDWQVYKYAIFMKIELFSSVYFCMRGAQI